LVTRRPSTEPRADRRPHTRLGLATAGHRSDRTAGTPPEPPAPTRAKSHPPCRQWRRRQRRRGRRRRSGGCPARLRAGAPGDATPEVGNARRGSRSSRPDHDGQAVLSGADQRPAVGQADAYAPGRDGANHRDDCHAGRSPVAFPDSPRRKCGGARRCHRSGAGSAAPATWPRRRSTPSARHHAGVATIRGCLIRLRSPRSVRTMVGRHPMSRERMVGRAGRRRPAQFVR
jgi:hypothetical protein